MDIDNICSSDPLRLTKLKKHQVVSLGQGAFGKVLGDDLVAIKEMSIKSVDEKKRFNMEIKTLLTMSEEFDQASVIDQGCYFKNGNNFNTYPINVKLGMERMLGDINKLRFNNRMNNLNKNIFWKIDVAIKMALALRKLHKAQLLHMDIKTDNILMMNKYTPVLADYGLTHTFQTATKETSRMGTQIYVPHEILSGIAPQYSEKSDVYAMGITLFELFQEQTLQRELNYKIVPTSLKKYLTKSFDTSFAKALDYNNKYNRQTVNDLIIDLLELLKKTFFSEENHETLVNGETLNLFDKYMYDEEEYYENSITGNGLKYQEVLKEKFQQRKQIYQKYINGGISNKDFTIDYNRNMVIDDIEKYTETKENIPEFFRENIGKNVLQKTLKKAVSNDINLIKAQSRFNQVDRKINAAQKFVNKRPINKKNDLAVIDENNQKLNINKVREVHPHPKPLPINKFNATQSKPLVMQSLMTNKQEKVQQLYEKYQKEWAKNKVKI